MQTKRFQSGDEHEIKAPMPLKLGELASFRVRPGQVVQCRRGSVWITIDNGGHDHVLNAGGRLTLNVGGRLVIEALMPSEIELRAQDEQTSNQQRRAIMKLINTAAPNRATRNIRNAEFNKDGIASALVLAASLFILLFASATAAVQAGGPAAAPTVRASPAKAPAAETRQLAERVSADIERNAKCHSAKLC